MIDIDAYLEDAMRKQYQPYYACFCFCFDRPMGEFLRSNAKYINWINQRHRDFTPMAKHLHGEKYFYEFMDYLKKYVTDARISQEDRDG